MSRRLRGGWNWPAEAAVPWPSDLAAVDLRAIADNDRRDWRRVVRPSDITHSLGLSHAEQRLIADRATELLNRR